MLQNRISREDQTDILGPQVLLEQDIDWKTSDQWSEKTKSLGSDSPNVRYLESFITRRCSLCQLFAVWQLDCQPIAANSTCTDITLEFVIAVRAFGGARIKASLELLFDIITPLCVHTYTY